jgi:hypothetical protein
VAHQESTDLPTAPADAPAPPALEKRAAETPEPGREQRTDPPAPSDERTEES